MIDSTELSVKSPATGLTNAGGNPSMDLRTMDLFAGCGGLSLGFERAGFDVVAAMEIWEPAAVTYEANFDHPVIRQDLSDVDGSVEWVTDLAPDVIVGSPPCQDFSHAGRKRGEGEKAALTLSYAEIVSRARPGAFVMENVGAATKSPTYQRARTLLSESGYGLTERILRASLCGCPQKRQRLFLVGVLGDPDESVGRYLDGNLADHDMTVREYLGDAIDTEHYFIAQPNYNRRSVFSIDEPAPTMRGINRPISPGYPGHHLDSCDVTTEEGRSKVRPLTTEERARIQTFPEDFEFVGSRTDRELMIGNAVPVNLARYVATALLRRLSDRSWETGTGTRDDSPGESDAGERPEVERMKLYLCGPITGHEDTADDRFSRAETALTAVGYDVVNPMGLSPIGTTREDSLRRDLPELCGCDGLCILGGWEDSAGCRLETSVAGAIGIPVRDLSEWVEYVPDGTE